MRANFPANAVRFSCVLTFGLFLLVTAFRAIERSSRVQGERRKKMCFAKNGRHLCKLIAWLLATGINSSQVTSIFILTRTNIIYRELKLSQFQDVKLS